MAPNFPKTYKAAIFKKANAPLALEDVELKLPEEGQILIKVLATGVCHSDAVVQAGFMGNTLYVMSRYIFCVQNTDANLLVLGSQVTKLWEMSWHWVPARKSGRLEIVWEPLGMEDTMVSSQNQANSCKRVESCIASPSPVPESNGTDM